MDTIGIFYQARIPESVPLAAEISDWLRAKGVDNWASSVWEEQSYMDKLAHTSLLIVLGGDGSTLHAARVATPHNVPIFGINLGRIGFLSEAQPDEWRTRLQKVLDGDCWHERRLMLHASLTRNGEMVKQFAALNDVVVGRGQQARVLRLHLSVDGDLVTTYTADALIVATPTGSTAYSMAAGGPLLPPQLDNFVVVPVAAHLSLDRPLILHEEAEISILVEMDHEAMLTADGQAGSGIQSGDRVVVKKHPRTCTFTRVDSAGYFYRRLMKRLGFSRSHG